jgi:hypothetical protein
MYYVNYLQVSKRDRNLDTALLTAGKFNDSFESLLSWLKETEELVGKQKPPSPDFKVVKAQLQEQKVADINLFYLVVGSLVIDIHMNMMHRV